MTKGSHQLTKSLKFQQLAEIFWTPSSPDYENVGIMYLIVIIKFGFLKFSNPPPLLHQTIRPQFLLVCVQASVGHKILSKFSNLITVLQTFNFSESSIPSHKSIKMNNNQLECSTSCSQSEDFV